jgi:hypothetical protein
MKTIVTHIGPDLDAITSVWLVKTFFQGWEEAMVAFVPAGTTLNKMEPDSNPDILHVDTGFGKFDHHQTKDDTICAATLVYSAIQKESGDNPALLRLVSHVNEIDHFKNVYYPTPAADMWDFDLSSIIEGWRLIYPEDPVKYVHLGFECLEAVYKTIQNKLWAEKELQEKAIFFDSKWGRSMGIATPNDDVIHLAQKNGIRLAMRKDPKKQYVRIKSLPDEDIDLTPLYDALKEKDPTASWFLHASHHMVLNGSTKNPEMKDLVVQVKEAKTGSFSFGGGYSTVDQLVGFVEVEQKNFDITNWPRFTGGGQDLLLRAEAGQLVGTYN